MSRPLALPLLRGANCCLAEERGRGVPHPCLSVAEASLRQDTFALLHLKSHKAVSLRQGTHLALYLTVLPSLYLPGSPASATGEPSGGQPFHPAHGHPHSVRNARRRRGKDAARWQRCRRPGGPLGLQDYHRAVAGQSATSNPTPPSSPHPSDASLTRRCRQP